jgi:hypothetical protein
MGGACSTYGESRGAYGALVGKPEGRRLLGRPKRSWKDNIKMYLREKLGAGAWIGSVLFMRGTGGGML